MPKVFLSHSSIDRDFARDLADDLQENGVETWLDARTLLVGDRFVDEIDRGLAGVEFVVLVLSKAFLRSEWTKIETEAALRKAIEARKATVIPLLLEDVWNDVSPLMRALLYVDFRERQNILKYREGLGQLLAKIKLRETSVALPRSRKKLTVLVTGGRETVGNNRDLEVAFELGCTLGRAKMPLRSGIAIGVDSQFAHGAVTAIDACGGDPREFLTCYTSKGQTPHHKFGRVLESRFRKREEGVPEIIDESDVGVLIGGGKNTMFLGVLMLLAGKPLLPIASTGGAAADLYSLVMTRYEATFGSSIRRDKLAVLADINSSPSDVATDCLRLIALLEGQE